MKYSFSEKYFVILSAPFFIWLSATLFDIVRGDPEAFDAPLKYICGMYIFWLPAFVLATVGCSLFAKVHRHFSSNKVCDDSFCGSLFALLVLVIAKSFGIPFLGLLAALPTLVWFCFRMKSKVLRLPLPAT